MRLKVCYVGVELGSSEFGQLMQVLFGHADTTRFELACYHIGARAVGSRGAERVRRFCHPNHVEAGGMPYAALCARARDDGCHVMVALDGWWGGNKMETFAMRGAPVQIVLQNWVATTGAAFIDAQVSDRVVSPPELAGHYAEKRLYMPHCYFIPGHALNNPHVPAALDAGGARRGGWEHPLAGVREQHGLPPSPARVFASFNQPYKFDPRTFGAWMRVLLRVPRSVLWLLRINAVAEENMKRLAERSGVAPSRLVFSDRFPKREHMVTKGLADVFLDSPLYNAHATAMDMLWARVPLVTTPLEKMASRVGASISAGARMASGGLIVRTLREYEELAVALARAPPSAALGVAGEGAAGRMGVRLRAMKQRMLSPERVPPRPASTCRRGYGGTKKGCARCGRSTRRLPVPCTWCCGRATRRGARTRPSSRTTMWSTWRRTTAKRSNNLPVDGHRRDADAQAGMTRRGAGLGMRSRASRVYV